MNAVMMLVWLAGADPVAPVAPKGAPVPGKPAPVYHAPAPVIIHGGAPGCCDTCDNGGHGGHKLLSRLRGLFHRNGGDDCCDTGHGHRHFHQRPANDCCDDGGHKLFGFLHRRRHHDDCDDCGHGGHRLLGKLRGLFHRNHDDCCPAPACNHCGTVHQPGAVIRPAPVPAPVKKGEPIPAPKGSGEPAKLPDDKKAQRTITPPPAGLSLQNSPLDLNR